MTKRRARLCFLQILDESFGRDEVEALAFHPDTGALAGFWHRQGSLCIGPQYSLDEAMRTKWILRDVSQTRVMFGRP